MKKSHSCSEVQEFRKNGTKFSMEFHVKTMPYPSPNVIQDPLTVSSEDQQHEINAPATRDIAWHKKTEKEDAHYHKEINTSKSTVKERYRLGEIVGKSLLMQHVYELILKAAEVDEPVLINGESGTGKELIARTIHHLSSRPDKKFVPVNCGAIPDTLFESELFGHRKGSFSGAYDDKPGLFDAAHQGTLFLDEVGELSLALQVKLLRALEYKEYTPVGSQTAKQADVRIISATNRNLADLIKTSSMREDFFYRLHVIEITVPPLRDHKDDIPFLVEHFLTQLGKTSDKPELTGKIWDQLYAYHWPGNIRELQNVLRRYVTTGHLVFADIHQESSQNVEAGNELTPGNLREAMDTYEKQFIICTLNHQKWHRANTAETLGIPTRTLHRKMKKYKLLRSSLKTVSNGSNSIKE